MNAGPRVEGVSFNEFILKNLHGTIKEHATSIIQGILKYLDLCEIRNGNRRYTKTSFLEFLAATDIEQKENFLKLIIIYILMQLSRILFLSKRSHELGLTHSQE